MRPVLEVADIFRRHGEAFASGRAAACPESSAASWRPSSVPHGGTRRSCRAVRRVQRGSHRLQLVPQSPLPQVPGAGAAAMARRPPCRVAAGLLFPSRLHAAGADRGDRPTEQGRRLRHPVQGRGWNCVDDRGRSSPSRRRDRHDRGAAYLGPDPPASPPRPLHRAGRRLAARRIMGRLQAGLLPADPRHVAFLPPPVPRPPGSGVSRWDLAVLPAPSSPFQIRPPSRLTSPRCATPHAG